MEYPGELELCALERHTEHLRRAAEARLVRQARAAQRSRPSPHHAAGFSPLPRLLARARAALVVLRWRRAAPGRARGPIPASPHLRLT